MISSASCPSGGNILLLDTGTPGPIRLADAFIKAEINGKSYCSSPEEVSADYFNGQDKISFLADKSKGKTIQCRYKISTPDDASSDSNVAVLSSELHVQSGRQY